MVKDNQIFIMAAIIAVLLFMSSKPSTQTVVAECQENEQCEVPLKPGYCSVNYECIAGKCYSEQIRCPEICDSLKDEDYDGFVDCLDPDCYIDPYCSCNKASYNYCAEGMCYCYPGSVARWIVHFSPSGGSGSCVCMEG